VLLAPLGRSRALTPLHAQLDGLAAALPTLCPDVVPRSVAYADLQKVQLRAPPAALEAFEAAVAALAAQAEACAICGAHGSPVAPSDEGKDQEQNDALRFTTRWRLDFQARTCQLCSGEFCCGSCRACLDAPAFIRFAALRAGQPGCEQWCGPTSSTV